MGIYLAVPLVASLALIWRKRFRQAETPAVKDAEPEFPSALVR